MSNNQQIMSGPLLAVAILGGSYLAHKGMGHVWSGVTNEPPPSEQDNAEVDVADAVTWAVVTGAVVGLLKFGIRRANYRGSPVD